MKRKCNIYAPMPITYFMVPIVGHVSGLNLTDEEIYICLCSKAEVEEVLPNGTIKSLNFTNYKTSVEEIKSSNMEDIVEEKNDEKPEDVIVLEDENIVEDTVEEIIDIREDTVNTQIASRNNNYYNKQKNKHKGKNRR